MKLSVVGGDMRNVSVIRQLAAAGYEVTSAGLEKADPAFVGLRGDSLEAALDGASGAVLPLPVTNDDLILNAPFSAERIELKKLFALLKGKRVFCGKATPAVKELAREEGVDLEDYFDREELQILNAIPTAEGALEIVMAELPVTIWGLDVLVCGYGRIGRYLARVLQALGAQVTVAARKQNDFAWIQASGCQTAEYASLSEKINAYDVIFNTVPACVLTRELLSRVKSDVLIVDLASKPGGVDLPAAGEYGRKVIWALSLPGKVAPVTAGKIIGDTIVNMLREVPR